ncbi:NAD(P)-binding protein [Pholiota conissans]|uniref:NAD(P)-binding protein n=1 Tax=Pholiota conissans TaxID=109636 RepID=A0A9P6CT98_9AGAR|nr:NAD(P)-binding protein [Pholiota conissans]
MSNSPNIYFVAGATRGIGLALVAEIAAKDASAFIYAGGRTPQAAPLLTSLASKYPGRIVPVKYVAGDEEVNKSIASEIFAKHGRVDTVIANAGIANVGDKIHEVAIKQFEDHFRVNVLGPIVLFQTFRDLLKSSAQPRFIVISSIAGSIELIQMSPFDIGVYGTSKAALNWAVRKIHFENEWLIAYPQCPGPVDTDMGVLAAAVDPAVYQEMLKNHIRQPDVVAGMLFNIFSTSTREKDGGQFHSVEGGVHAW